MSTLHHLSTNHSILNQYIAEIRDHQIQKDHMRFRRNIERIGQIIAYEVSKSFTYQLKDIQTPLGTAPTHIPQDRIVIASVLRAGLAIHNAMLEAFDQAENCFISAYRKHTTPEHFDVCIEYLASPSIQDKTLILCDPMLATGRSMQLAYETALTRGTPQRVIICSIIASQQGIDHITQHIPNANIYIATIDPHLDAQAHIVPGLGDLGDLAYGEKL